MTLIAKHSPFSRPDIAHILHLTDAQEEVWHSCLLGGDDANRAYNESLTLKLKGAVDRNAMERSLQELVRRHELLRSVFSPDGKFICVYAEIDLKVDYRDISNLSISEKTSATKEYIRQDAFYTFDLIEGPLIKVGLLKWSDDDFHLIITVHHIVCDGWSFGILLQELGILYSANVQHTESKLPKPVPYSEYIEHLRYAENTMISKVNEKFWLDQFKNGVPQTDLPTDYDRPNLRTYKSQRLDVNFDKKLLEELKSVGVKENCSLVITLLSAFEIYLYSITGQDQLVLGLPAAGQSAMGAKHLVGHCVNLLPIRSKLGYDDSFVDFLKKRKSANFDAFEHQEMSFGQLLKKLPVSRDASRIPLVPVVFNIDMGLADGVDFHGLNYELISNPREFETFELFLNATGTQRDLVLEWSYNIALFDEDRIRNMMADFEKTVRHIVAEPMAKLSKLALTDNSDAYAKLNATKTSLPSISVYTLFQNQAQNSPDSSAIKFGKKTFSYHDIESRVNQLSHYLREKGVKPNDIVALAAPRTEYLPMVMLALLQCGAAYLPLDPEYPQQRLDYMLKDSGAKSLITTKKIAKRFSKLSSPLFLEDIIHDSKNHATTPMKTVVAPEALAYLLYTSGSTGRPKGVPITNKNLVNFLRSIAKKPGIQPSDRLLASATISFDISVLEIFLPLISGATMVLVDTPTSKDGRLLREVLIEEKVTIFQATPTTWQMLFNAGWEETLPLKALAGGEALTTALARRILAQCKSLWNMYGPTETTIWSSIKEISVTDETITVGKPIANTQMYILNNQGRLAAPGKVGEIAIGGAGVANGYWLRPELSKEKFKECIFQQDIDSLMYLTGDLGKLLPSGELLCLGRTDQQIKVRGHRIEPGEIEHILNAIDGISDAAIASHLNRLVAYVEKTGSIENLQEQISHWKHELSAQLPDYMVPQEFLILENLPKTPSGKLDRKRLSDIKPVNSLKKLNNKPRTKAEQDVADIWQECLQLTEIDIRDNFFEMGGHSLIAVQVMTKLEQNTGKRFPLSVLFEYPTVEKMARLIQSKEKLVKSGSLVHIKPKGNKPPIYIVHGFGLNVLNFFPLALYMDADQPIFGLQGKGLDGTEELLTSVEDMAAHYINTITEFQPDGPFALAGYSFGGIVAYEMARQLKEQGRQITILAILDTHVAPHYKYSSKLGKQGAKLSYFMGQKWLSLKLLLGSLDGFKQKTKNIRTKLDSLRSKTANEEQSRIELGYSDNEEIVETNNRAIEEYHLKSTKLHVDLFRAEQVKKAVYVPDPIYLGWKSLASKGITIHDIPGDHFSMFSSPNDEKFAQILQIVLDKRHSEL